MKGTDFGMLVLCFVISTVLRTEFIMVNVLNTIDSYLYYPVLIIVLIAGGLYFSGRIKFAQIRLFGESVRVVMEKPEGDNQVSSFQALMVSTASRVGTGNIIGVPLLLFWEDLEQYSGCGFWRLLEELPLLWKVLLLRYTNTVIRKTAAMEDRGTTLKVLSTRRDWQHCSCCS